MNSIHNNGENDKSLNEDLDKLGRGYAGLEQDEPPELLDQAILNSAHRALEKKPHWMKFGWLHGLTTAAVFVLALSLIINQREQAPVVPDGIDRESLSLPKLDVSAEKPSAKAESDDFRQVKKELNAGRSAAPDNTPSDAEAGSPPATVPSRSSEMAPEPMAIDQLLLPDTVIGDEADADLSAEIEEVVVQEETPAVQREETIRINAFRHQSAVAASPEIEMKERTDTDPETEQQLLAIIRLKQSGDPRWEAELQAFVENHPDYPLPDELKN